MRTHETILINMAFTCIKERVGGMDFEELDFAVELKLKSSGNIASYFLFGSQLTPG